MALLPGAIVAAVVLWLVFAPFEMAEALGLGVALVSTMTMLYANNAFRFIRIRSWMVSSLFLFLTAVSAPVHGWNPLVLASGLLYIIYIMALLSTYQSKRPQAGTFLAMVSLSVLTMQTPLLVCLLPAALIAMVVTLRTFNAHTLLAALFGILLPYELWLAWHVWAGSLGEGLASMGEGLAAFALPEIVAGDTLWDTLYMTLCNQSTLFALLITLFGLPGIIHFYYTSFNDKIRTRMYYSTLIVQWPVLLLLLLFAGTDVPMLTVMLLVCSCPILAHYFVFSKGLAANIFFWLFILSCFFLALRLL